MLAFTEFSRHTIASSLPPKPRGFRMSNLELKTIATKSPPAFGTEARPQAQEDSKQRNLMVSSLCLLLLALAIVLWHDRDFWFPDAPEEADQSVENQPVQSAPLAKNIPVQTPVPVSKPSPPAKSKHASQRATRKTAARAPKPSAATTPALEVPAPPIAVTSRTVLPPLEIEVVAGDKHRTLRPGSNSVRVDLQPGMPAEPVAEPSISADSQNAANITSDASERVQMSADATEIIAKPVRPNYPMLARQMKVQGSVILQAMIGRDGIIQDLHVVSGPHILASAAEDAVRQWHFKPHFEGSEAVETQAKITVNFTISTN